MKVGQIFFIIVLGAGVFSASAWDIAVAVEGQIHFLNATGGMVGSLSEGMSEVNSLVYNSDLKRMYFSDNERTDGSIYDLTVPDNLTSKPKEIDIHTVVTKQDTSVKGVAYDDMTGILYWSNGEGHAILWIRVSATDKPQAGQPLLRFSNEVPVDLAIDTCKRYLYWTNCGLSPTIERSLLDGSKRQTIISTDLRLPCGLVVDQTSDRLYWVDELAGAELRIESSDLNGQDRKLFFYGADHQPYGMAVSKGSVFWADHIHKSIWRLPLDTPHSTNTKEPVRVMRFSTTPYALVSSESGRWTRDHCNPVTQPNLKMIPATITKVSMEAPVVLPISHANKSQTACSNRGIMLDLGFCDCEPRYSGLFCEVDECLEFCVYGTCYMDVNHRKCQCTKGYTGERCEVSVCHNYCVTGSCSVDVTGEPKCHCEEGFAGDRCEVNFTQQQELEDNLQEVCKTFCKLWAKSSQETLQPFDVCRCPEFEALAPLDSEWKTDYPLVALLALCSVLMVIIAVLAKKVYVLGKRPRVKKRIIVNKSVTPLTCRPSPDDGEQCEITIENCCNMNICETPCFEPDFRQPQAILTKSNNKGAKEEKKTLLGNMELPPDDLY